MTAKEMEALVEAVTREVMAALSNRAGGSTSSSACPCNGGCGCSKTDAARTSGLSESEPPTPVQARFEGRLLTEAVLRKPPFKDQSEILLGPGVIVTPLARDRAAAAGIRFVSDSGRNGRRQCPPRQSRPALDQIAYFTAKPALTIERILRTEIESTGAEIDVCPATRRVEEELDGALSCAGRVSEGSIQRAIVLAEDVYLVQRHANRLPGVRARVCWDAQGALESRRCDDANVLLVSGRLLGQTMVRRIVQAWLSE